MLAAVDPLKRVEACGPRPSNVCRFLYDRPRRVGVAKFGDWVVRTPLQIVFVVVVAYMLNRLLRRAIRRFTARIEGSASSGRLKRMRERTPAMLLSTGEVNLRSAARRPDHRRRCCAVSPPPSSGRSPSSTCSTTWASTSARCSPAPAWRAWPSGSASQSLVRDFLSGMFMLIEDQYGVGDMIDVGVAAGVVEAGVASHHPIARHQRNRLARAERSDPAGRQPVAAVGPSGARRRGGPEDQRRALEAVILTAAKEVWADDRGPTRCSSEPEVLGVEYLGPDAMAIRLIGKTRPGSQFTMSRVLRARVAAALDEAGIERPEALWTRAGTPPPASTQASVMASDHDAPAPGAPLLPRATTVHDHDPHGDDDTHADDEHAASPIPAGCSCRCSSDS